MRSASSGARTPGAAIPTRTVVPPGATALIACSIVSVRPRHSIAWSNPSGIRSRPASTVSVAPSSSASSSFDGTTSTATIGEAPAILRPLDRREPDAAAPDHEHRIAGAHPRRVQHRADAGHDRAAQERDLLERQRRVHREHGVRRHDRALGERGRHVVVDPRLPVREPRRPVGEEAGVEHAQPFAHDRAPGGAPAARAAVRQPRADDVVAGLDARSTPSPTSSTTAEPSWPSTIGIAWRWTPWTAWESERHTPEAAIRIATSPVLGGSRSSSSMRRSSTSQSTAARMRGVSRTPRPVAGRVSFPARTERRRASPRPGWVSTREPSEPIRRRRSSWTHGYGS